jgi:hypothetical protein
MQFSMDRFILLLAFGLLTSCASHRPIVDSYNITTVDKLKLVDAINSEKSINSTDKTPIHHVGIGTGLYPNNKNYELATPSTFLREGTYFETLIRYYYSNSDSIVRVISYQWGKKDLKAYETKNELKEKFKRYKTQWNDIEKEMNKEFGSPILRDIQSREYGNRIIEESRTIEEIMDSTGSAQNSTAWINRVKWSRNNHIAYLIMHGDNKSGYRQINLFIYSE